MILDAETGKELGRPAIAPVARDRVMLNALTFNAQGTMLGAAFTRTVYIWEVRPSGEKKK